MRRKDIVCLVIVQLRNVSLLLFLFQQSVEAEFRDCWNPGLIPNCLKGHISYPCYRCSICFLYYPGLRISDSVMGVLRIVLDQPDTRDTLWFEIPDNIGDTYFFVGDITIDASAIGILLFDHLLVYDLQSLGQENVSNSSVIPLWRSVP